VLRRDLLATLLGLLPVSGVWSDAVAIARTAADAVERADIDGKPGDGDPGGEAWDSGGVPGDSGGMPGDSDGEPGNNRPTTRTAVVDRIEGDVAVLLFDSGGGTKPVPTAVLPAAAREAGIVLRVPRGDSIALATVDRAATARRRRAAGDRFDDLAEPAPDAADGENETAP
jgi:hypothetical protein